MANAPTLPIGKPDWLAFRGMQRPWTPATCLMRGVGSVGECLPWSEAEIERRLSLRAWILLASIYGAQVPYVVQRQVPVWPNGRIDLVIDHPCGFSIVEVKRHIFDARALAQLLDYRAGMDVSIPAFARYCEGRETFTAIGVAPDIDERTKRAIAACPDVYFFQLQEADIDDLAIYGVPA